MSREIGPIPYTSGQALNAAFFNDAGQVRDVAAGAWVDPAAAAFAHSLAALNEDSTSGVFFGDLPSGLSRSSDYTVVIYEAGAAGFGDKEHTWITVKLLAEEAWAIGIPDGLGLDTTLTAADVIALARTILRDAAAVRWDDPELLTLVGAGVNRAFRKRPDLRSQGSYKPQSTSETVPLDYGFLEPLAHCVAGLALAQGDNPADAGIVALHIKTFDDALAGV